VAKKGIPFLGLCRLRRKRVSGLELLLDYNLSFWVADCGEWTFKKAIPPFGLIASTQAWITIEIK